MVAPQDESPRDVSVSDEDSKGAVRSQLARIEEDLVEIRRQTRLNDEEIDILQVESAKRSRTWYKEPAVLVSRLALVTSVLATVLSQMASASGQEYQERTRLTAALEEIAASQSRSAELQVQYGDRAPIATITEVSLLTREAERLSDRVGAEPFERLVIAEAYIYVNDLDNALRVASAAKTRVTSPLDLVEANRTIARVHYSRGDLAEGRKAFVENAQVSESPTSPLRGTVRTQYMFENNFNWSSAELNVGSCPEAVSHASKAVEIVAQFPEALRPNFARRATALGEQVRQACRQ